MSNSVQRCPPTACKPTISGYSCTVLCDSVQPPCPDPNRTRPWFASCTPRSRHRSHRLQLPPRRKPYGWAAIAPGLRLGYRRNKRGAGSWVLAVADGRGGEWTARVGAADDVEDADGEHSFSFWQAADRGRQLARGQSGDNRPATFAMALDTYQVDLIARGGDPVNASRVRHHLPPTLLAKPVALLYSRRAAPLARRSAGGRAQARVGGADAAGGARRAQPGGRSRQAHRRSLGLESWLGRPCR